MEYNQDIKKERKKGLILIIVIMLIIVFISGATYAWLTWDSESNTAVTITAEEGAILTIDGGGDIASNKLAPTFECNNSNYAIQRTITASAINGTQFNMLAYIQLYTNSELFPDVYKMENFEWVVSSSATDCTSSNNILASGNFANIDNSTDNSNKENTPIDLVSFYVPANTTIPLSKIYYLYIWVNDEYVIKNYGDDVTNSIQDVEFTLELTGKITNDPDVVPYIVSYDFNGGTGSVGKQEKKYNVDLILSNDVPIKEGYTFLGWSTSADDSTVVYNSGDIYTENSAVTLYAVWKANDSTPPTCSLSANSSTISATYSDNGESGIAYYGWDSSFTGTNSSSKAISKDTHTFYVKDGAGNTNSCSITVTSVGRACPSGYSATGYGADSTLACYKASTNTYKVMDYVCNSQQTRECASGWYATGYDADHNMACYRLKEDNSCCWYQPMDTVGTSGTMIGTSYCVYK